MANTSVIFKGEYAKLLAKTGIEFKDETKILPYAGDPNEAVEAPKGSLVLDKTNGKIYQNTDGGDTWSEVSKETAQQRINLTSTESPYTISGDFHNTIYAVDLTAGDVIVNLPAVSTENEGKCLFIYIEINPGNANKLTINTNGTDTIRGQTSVEMNVLRDGFRLVSHTYSLNHWDALSWERTDEIVYQPGNSGVTSITTIQELLDYSLSSTEISGGAITNNGNGTISVAASEWKLRNADSSSADCRVYSIPAEASLAPTNNATSYLVVDYNSGAPQYTIETDITTISCRDKCVKAILFRWGTQVDILEIGRYSVDHNALYARKQSVTDWLGYGSGLQPSWTNLQFSFTSGSLYSGVIRHEAAALSSTADEFEYWYRDGLGGWTVTTGNTDINNTNYDDGTGTLAALLNTQKYGVHWIYISVDNPSRLLVVFGQEEHDSLSGARNAQIPSVLPPFAQKYSTGKLVGKAIVKKSATALTDIETPFDTVFTSSSPVSHNDLAGRDVAGNHAKLIPISDGADALGFYASDGTTKLMTFNSSLIKAYFKTDFDLTKDGRINFELVSYDDDIADCPIIRTKHARGTEASPANNSDGDFIGSWIGQYYNATLGGFSNAAAIQMKVDGTPDGGDASNTPGKIGFYTCPQGTAALTERMTIRENGDITFGTEFLFDSTQGQTEFKKDVGGIIKLERLADNTVAGNFLGRLDFGAEGNFTNKTSASIIAMADGTWAASDTPSRITFHTCPTGSSSTAERMRIDSAGNVGIGIAPDSNYKLNIDGNIRLGNGSNSDLVFVAADAAGARTRRWHISVRTDVGGINDDLKILRYTGAGPTYEGIAMQIDNSTGDAWFENDVSALSFTDRTPYPKDLQTAIDAVNSMERLPDGEYNVDDKEKQLDHSKLHTYLQGRGTEPNRDMSAAISCLNEVVKHLLKENEHAGRQKEIDSLKSELAAVKKQIELLRKELGLKPLFTKKSLFRRAIEAIKGKGK